MKSTKLNLSQFRKLKEDFLTKLCLDRKLKDSNELKTHNEFYSPFSTHIEEYISSKPDLVSKLQERFEKIEKKRVELHTQLYPTSGQLSKFMQLTEGEVAIKGETYGMKKIFLDALSLYIYDQTYEQYLIQAPEIKTNESTNIQGAFYKGIDSIVGMYSEKEAETMKIEIKIIETFIDNFQQFLDALKRICSKFPNCNIQILLASPFSKVTTFRKNALERKSTKIDDNISRLGTMINRCSYFQQIKVKLYDDLPGMAMYAIEDTMYLAYFWNHQPAIEGPYTAIYGEHQMKLYAEAHFNKLWETSAKLDFYNLDDSINMLKRSKTILDGPNSHEYSPANDKDALHFKCHFWRTGSIDSFCLSIGRKLECAEITFTTSGDRFKGNIVNTDSVSILVLETIGTQRKRVAYFILNKGFYDEELSIGLLTNIRPAREEDIGVTGHVVVQKTDKVSGDEAEIAREVQMYLKDKEMLLKGGRNKINSLGKLQEKLGKKYDIYRGLAGEYSFYSIHGKTSKLYKGAFRINEIGEVRFLRKEGIADYVGVITVLDDSHVLIQSNISKERPPFYYMVLKISTNKMKGIYVGVEGVVNGGRIYMKKEKEGYLDGAKIESIDWKEVDKSILEDMPDLKLFFQGGASYDSPLMDFLLDNPANFSIVPNIIKMPYSPPLYGQAGVYSYYYLSSDSRKGFRRIIIQINEGGEVEVKAKKLENFLLEGKALRYGNLLHIFLFRKYESDKKVYIGMLILFCKREAENHLMPGIMGGISESGNPISRRVIMVKESSEEDNNLQEVYERLDPEIMDFDNLLKKQPKLKDLGEDFFLLDKKQHFIVTKNNLEDLYERYFG